MHSINFQIKRAHLRILAFGRAALEKLGTRSEMTPARFDLLYAIRQRNISLQAAGKAAASDHRGAGLKQNELTRVLGLSRQTVSKMLLRLEEMGWVARARANGDRRTRDVRLTALGLQKTWYAMRRIFRGRIFLSAYEKHFASGSAHVLARISAVWKIIDSIACYFADASSLTYDFGLGPSSDPVEPRERRDRGAGGGAGDALAG
jgi:DNA-binding MarR family transcriptional regulator